MLLMMMLMLNYSKSWCQISTLPTGGQTDSVLISIDYIKLYDAHRVNVKLTKDVDSQKSKVRFLGGTALASTLAFLVCIILK